MTEAEWLAAIDPRSMIWRWGSVLGDSWRRIQLLGIETCKLLGKFLISQESRQALDHLERYVDQPNRGFSPERILRLPVEVLNLLNRWASITIDQQMQFA